MNSLILLHLPTCYGQYNLDTGAGWAPDHPAPLPPHLPQGQVQQSQTQGFQHLAVGAEGLNWYIWIRFL